jgi:hypothetical protein
MFTPISAIRLAAAIASIPGMVVQRSTAFLVIAHVFLDLGIQFGDLGLQEL